MANPTRFSNLFFKQLLKLDWTIREWEGPKQYGNNSMGEDLMLLPTDWALTQDPDFKHWVQAYADDRELFYDHFSKAFAKLIELGVDRKNNDYESAPKKSDEPGANGTGRDEEAEGLAADNAKHNKRSAKLSGGCPYHVKAKL